jgi:hypothetical protein
LDDVDDDGMSNNSYSCILNTVAFVGGNFLSITLHSIDSFLSFDDDAGLNLK